MDESGREVGGCCLGGFGFPPGPVRVPAPGPLKGPVKVGSGSASVRSGAPPWVRRRAEGARAWLAGGRASCRCGPLMGAQVPLWTPNGGSGGPRGRVQQGLGVVGCRATVFNGVRGDA